MPEDTPSTETPLVEDTRSLAEKFAERSAELSEGTLSKEEALETTTRKFEETTAKEAAVVSRTKEIEDLDVGMLLHGVSAGREMVLQGPVEAGYESPDSILEMHAKSVGMTPMEYRGNLAKHGYGWEWMSDAVGREGKSPVEVLAEAKSRGTLGLMPEREREIRMRGESLREAAIEKFIEKGEPVPDAYWDDSFVISGTRNAIIGMDADEEGMADMFSGGEQDKILSRTGEKGYVKAQLESDMLLALPGVARLVTEYSGDFMGGEKYLRGDNSRVTQLAAEYRRINGKEASEAVVTALTLQAAHELATFKMVGVWHSPIFIRSDTIMPNERGTGDRTGVAALYDAFAPTVEIVGVDNKNKFVVREATAMSHIFDKADALQAGVVGAWKYGGLEGALQGISENRNLLEASIETAADEDMGTFGMAALGGVGLLGMMYSPDLLFGAAGAPKLLKKTGDTALVLKGGPQAAKALTKMLEAHKAGNPDLFADLSRDFARKYKPAAEQIDSLTVGLSSLMAKQNPDIAGPEGAKLADMLPGKAGEQRVNIAPTQTKVEAKLSTKTRAEKGEKPLRKGEVPKRAKPVEETPIVTPELYNFKRQREIVKAERDAIELHGVNDVHFKGQLHRATVAQGSELINIVEKSTEVGSKAAQDHHRQLRGSLGEAMRDPDAWYVKQQDLLRQEEAFGMHRTYAGNKKDALKAIDDQVAAGALTKKAGKAAKKQINDAAKARASAFEQLRKIKDEAAKRKKELPNKKDLLAALDRADEAIKTNVETRAAATYIFYSSLMDAQNPFGKKWFGVGKKRTDLLNKTLLDDMETYKDLSEHARNFSKQAIAAFKISRREALNASAWLEARARNAARRKGITVSEWWETRVKGIETEEDLQKIIDDVDGGPPRGGVVDDVVDEVDDVVDDVVDEVDDTTVVDDIEEIDVVDPPKDKTSEEARSSISQGISELLDLIDPLEKYKADFGVGNFFMKMEIQRLENYWNPVSGILHPLAKDLESFTQQVKTAIKDNRIDLDEVLDDTAEVSEALSARQRIDRVLKEMDEDIPTLLDAVEPPTKPVAAAEELGLPPAKPLPKPPKGMPKANKKGFGRVELPPIPFEKENKFLAEIGDDIYLLDDFWEQGKHAEELAFANALDLQINGVFKQSPADLRPLRKKGGQIYAATRHPDGEKILRKDFPEELQEDLRQYEEALEYVTDAKVRAEKRGLPPRQLYDHLVQFDARVNPDARLTDVVQWLYDYGGNAGCRAICRRLIQSGQVDGTARFFILNGSGDLSIGKLDAYLLSKGQGKVGTKPSDFHGLASASSPGEFSWNIARGSGYGSTGLNEETLVHELLHNVTSDVLYQGLSQGRGTPAFKKAAKELDDFAVQIYDIAEKEFKRLTAKPARTSADLQRYYTAKQLRQKHVLGSQKKKFPHRRFSRSTELISYGMTDPATQKFLRSIPIEEVLKAGEQPRSMLDKFVELIGRLFSPGGRKLPAVEENAWHRAILLSEDMIAATTTQAKFVEKAAGIKGAYFSWRGGSKGKRFETSRLIDRLNEGGADVFEEFRTFRIGLNNFIGAALQPSLNFWREGVQVPPSDLQLAKLRKKIDEYEADLPKVLEKIDAAAEDLAKAKVEKGVFGKNLKDIEYWITLSTEGGRVAKSADEGAVYPKKYAKLTQTELEDLVVSLKKTLKERPNEGEDAIRRATMEELMDLPFIDGLSSSAGNIRYHNIGRDENYWKIYNLPKTATLQEAADTHLKALKEQRKGTKALADKALADETASLKEQLTNAIEAEHAAFRDFAEALRKDDPFAGAIYDAAGAPSASATRDFPPPPGDVVARADIGTPEFKRWFGDSKVVDDAGKPLVMYHGSRRSRGFEAFDPTKRGSALDTGFLGEGFYFSTKPDTAAYYAGVGRAPRNMDEIVETSGFVPVGREGSIVPTYLSLKNPYDFGTKTQGIRGLVMRGDRLPDDIHDAVVKRAGFEFDPDLAKADYSASVTQPLERDLSRAMREVLTERGYDGAIARIGDELEIVAFESTQIKSVYNRGTWDPDRPEILKHADKEDRQLRMGLKGLKNTVAGRKSLQATLQGSTAPEAARFLIDNLEDAAEVKIAERILPHLSDDIRISIHQKGFPPELVPDEITMPSGSKGAARALFAWSSTTGGGELYFRGAQRGGTGMTGPVVLHELLHAATASRLRQAKKAPKGSELRNARRAIIRLQTELTKKKNPASEWEDFGKYSFDSLDHPWVRVISDPETGLDELISYGLTDKKFQDYLKTVKIEGETAFNKFVRVVAELLGIPKNETNALTELIRVTDELLIAPAAPTRIDEPARLLSAVREDPRVVDHAGPFYSALERRAQHLPRKMQIDAVIPWLRKQPGVKGEEIEYTYMDLFIEDMKAQGKTHLNADEVVDYLQKNQVEIQEITPGQMSKARKAAEKANLEAYKPIEALMNEAGVAPVRQHAVYATPSYLLDSASAFLEAVTRTASDRLDVLEGLLRRRTTALQSAFSQTSSERTGIAVVDLLRNIDRSAIPEKLKIPLGDFVKVKRRFRDATWYEDRAQAVMRLGSVLMENPEVYEELIKLSGDLSAALVRAKDRADSLSDIVKLSNVSDHDYKAFMSGQLSGAQLKAHYDKVRTDIDRILDESALAAGDAFADIDEILDLDTPRIQEQLAVYDKTRKIVQTPEWRAWTNVLGPKERLREIKNSEPEGRGPHYYRYVSGDAPIGKEQNYREILIQAPGSRKGPRTPEEEAIDERWFSEIAEFTEQDASFMWPSLTDSFAKEIYEGWDPPRTAPYVSHNWDEDAVGIPGGYPDVVTHIRTRDISDPEGKKVLLVEEIQSDWHQEGRVQGYSKEENQALRAKYFKTFESVQKELRDFAESFDVRLAEGATSRYVPTFPDGTHAKGIGIRHIEKMRTGGFRVDHTSGTVKSFDRLSELKSYVRQDIFQTLDNYWPRAAFGQAWDFFENPVVKDIVGRRHSVKMKIQKNERGHVPDAPFKKNWPALAVKRILHLAAEEGYDSVAFTKGDVIQGVSGGDLAGQRYFYDKVLPKVVAKEAKQVGGQVTRRTDLDFGDLEDARYQVLLEDDGGVVTVKLTEDVSDEILQGRPLFQKRVENGVEVEKASVSFLEDGRAVVRALEQPDFSSLVHEIGHIIRRDMDPEELDEYMFWLKGEPHKLNVEVEGSRLVGTDAEKAEELFASAFEAYLRDGIAPTKGMVKVFEDAKRFLVTIYATLAKDDRNKIQVVPEVSAILDKMLGEVPSHNTGFHRLSKALKDEVIGPNSGLGEVSVAARMAEEIRRILPKGESIITEEELLRRIKKVEDKVNTDNATTFDEVAIELPFPIFHNRFEDGKDTFTLREIINLQETLEAERFQALRQSLPEAYTETKVKAVTEMDPADRIMNMLSGPGWSRQLGRAWMSTLFGGDSQKIGQKSMRVFPPLLRSDIHAGGRVIEQAYGETVRLVGEGDWDKIEDYLTGELTTFKFGGRQLFSSGHDAAQGTYELIRRVADELKPEELTSLREIFEFTTPWKMEKNTGNIADRAFDDVYPTVAGTEALNAQRAWTAIDKLLSSNGTSLFMKDLAGALGMTGKPTSQQFRFIEGLLYAAGVTTRKDAFIDMASEGARKAALKGLFEDTASAFGSKSGKMNRSRLAILMAGHGQVNRIYNKWSVQGLAIKEDVKIAFLNWSNGEKVADELLPEVQEVTKRYGLNAHFFEEPALDSGYFLPEIARDRLAEALARGKEKAWDIGDALTKSERDMGNVFGGFYRYMKLRMTRGAFAVRQRYFFMNTIDHFSQMAMITGMRPAVVSTIRVVAQDVMVIPGVARTLGLLEVTGIKPHAMEKVRRALQKGGDKAARAVGKLLRVSKYRLDLNGILDGSTKTVRMGNRTYDARAIRDIMVEEGIFASFDTTQLANVIRKSATGGARKWELPFGLESKWAKAEPVVSTVGEKAEELFLKTVTETAEAWAERERAGAMLTLMEMGMSPRAAARTTIDALYDYAGSMSKMDRAWFVSLLFPFWAFQKNANKQVINLLFSPAGVYRMGVIRRAEEGIPELFAALMWEQLTGEDPYGIYDVESLPPEVQDQYYIFRDRLENGYGPIGDLSGADKQRLYKAFNEHTIDKLTDAEISVIENGYGSPENMPKELRLAIRQLFIAGHAAGSFKSDGKAYQGSEFLARYAGFTDEGGQAIVNELRDYAIPRPDRSGRASYLRERAGLPVPPIMTENVRKYYSHSRSAGTDNPYTEFLLPDSTIKAGMRHTANMIAFSILAADDLGVDLGMMTDEEAGGAALMPSVPFEQVLRVRDTPIPGLFLDMVTEPSLQYPRRIHPAIASHVEDVFNLRLLRISALENDPFQDDIAAFGAEEGKIQTAEEEYIRGGGLLLTEEKVYMMPGVWRLLFENSPLGELNRIMMTMPTNIPLVDTGVTAGEGAEFRTGWEQALDPEQLIQWARFVTGVQTAEVRPHRAARLESRRVPEKLK